MTKNIRVVDDRNNDYGATYPKRAKSLVKQGRARFIDEHTICLACPPKHLEEFYMNNTATAASDAPKDNGPRPGTTEALKAAVTETISKAGAREGFPPEAEKAEEKVTVASILARMDKIINDTSHIRESLDALREFREDPVTLGDGATYNGAGGYKAKAIALVVEAREATNQQILRLLEKFYDDLIHPDRPPAGDKLQRILDMLGNINPGMPHQIADILAESLKDLLKSM